ncbi:MAG: hypothetical protein LAO05_03040 [Acidobacteriia bacterium]|nr:hypothetical protein [Terriglobia bacterium]
MQRGVQWVAAVAFSACLLQVGALANAASGPIPGARQPSVDDNDTLVLRGNVHPLARPDLDIGAADPSLPMERMVLSLGLRPDKQAELDEFLANQQNPASPDFHRWLTPQQFGARFGPAPEDRALVAGWLRSRGFVIDEVAVSGTWLSFSGTAGDVNRAFHTEIRDYFVDGELRHANASDPAIPRALSGLVAGVVSLHDFPLKSAPRAIRPLRAGGVVPGTNMTDGSHALSPGDFATIYDVKPIYAAGIDGSGQSIAIVGRSNINLADVQYFRTFFGLPPNDPQVIVSGDDPGIVCPDPAKACDESEADLDVEWAGAIAKNAVIKLVISKSTSATDGSLLAAAYIVNNNLAQVVSASFYECESDLGVVGNAFVQSLWSQAAAQGMTVVVSSGDSGASGCDPADAASGTGRAVSGMCSTGYDVCIGGTQFMDTADPGAYWASANDPTTKASALSYIPEQAWNESAGVSGGSGLWATGGGASTLYHKPSWQVAPGVPADGARDVPDVSLSAAAHDGYLAVHGHTSSVSGLGAFYGTSASAPSFAGLMALVVQQAGARQGNANPRLYQLGNTQFSGVGPAVFHDITTGDNSVPSLTGFSCGTGYDLATGLGSVDAALMVNNWVVASTADFTISASTTLVPAAQGTSRSATITTTVSGDFSKAISLSATGLPSGATAVFNPTAIPEPGAGSSTLTLTAGALTPVGTYAVTITGTAGSGSHSVTVSFVVSSAGDALVFSDGFDGPFPGSWHLTYTLGSESTTLWGQSGYRKQSGSSSAWCAGGGSQPSPPGGSYVPNMLVWLYYGPFDLSDANEGTVAFDLWNDCEPSTSLPPPDRLEIWLSTDGFATPGNQQGVPTPNTNQQWAHFTYNVSSFRTISALGSKTVYLAFIFRSGSVAHKREGSYVDNVVITKKTPQTCNFSLSPSSQSFSSAGGTGTVGVTDLVGAGCSWTAASNAAWITVTSGANGAGNGSVGYAVAGNASAARVGTLTIAGQTFSVSQSAPCTYALDSHTASFTSAGGPGNVAVVAPGGCAWTATTASAWIHITGGSGTGNGAVTYTVDANSGPVRSGTITVQTQTLTVNQDAGSSLKVAQWLPAVIHKDVPSKNARWRSDVAVLNRSSQSANVTLRLYAPAGTQTMTIAVSGKAQALLHDVASQLGVTADSGPLEVVSDQDVFLTGRTYNQVDATHTYGQDYNGQAPSELLAAGDMAWLPQLTENALVRTNIGITNAGAATANVTVTLYTSAGNPAGWSDTRDYAPGQFYQYQQPYLGLGGIDSGYAVVTVNSGSGVVTYASVVDQNTDDPTTINMKR